MLTLPIKVLSHGTYWINLEIPDEPTIKLCISSKQDNERLSKNIELQMKGVKWAVPRKVHIYATIEESSPVNQILTENMASSFEASRCSN